MRKLLLWITALAVVFMCFAVLPLIHKAAAADGAKPTDGWTVHIDAEKHFGDNPTEVAHHYCRNVAGGWLECQIYDSDRADAHLVGIETIVPPAIYKKLPANEQALWHWHKTEIPKVNATMPGMSPDEQKKMVAKISDTYGKVYIIFDPVSTNALPLGNPTVTILK
ncbi:MAG: OBAP family protein [Candidatus Eremiobacteraeota bacterium]|nr:OBAP family protein [Candidatus Eremiobacteraeota bacterium]